MSWRAGVPAAVTGFLAVRVEPNFGDRHSDCQGCNDVVDSFAVQPNGGCSGNVDRSILGRTTDGICIFLYPMSVVHVHLGFVAVVCGAFDWASILPP